MPADPAPRKPASKSTLSPLGIAIGLCMGVGYGIALDNLAMGVGVGLCFGASLGLALGSARRKK
jgi:threonine/homoserine efflux transporter RhtA